MPLNQRVVHGRHRRPIPAATHVSDPSSYTPVYRLPDAGMASKWRWRERMQEARRATNRPNLVLGVNAQVCWEKFTQGDSDEGRVSIGIEA